MLDFRAHTPEEDSDSGNAPTNTLSPDAFMKRSEYRHPEDFSFSEEDAIFKQTLFEVNDNAYLPHTPSSDSESELPLESSQRHNNKSIQIAATMRVRTPSRYM